MTKVALVTVVFPANLPYVRSFLESVRQQSFKNFELLIFNDGIKDFDQQFDLTDYKAQVLNCSGRPLAIRILAINTAIQMGFEKIIFNDSDDIASINRVEVLSSLLDKYQIVSNDLDLIDEKGNLISKNYWSNRFEDDCIIEPVFLQDKNIIGFGNTAIRSDSRIPDKFIFDPSYAPDWLFFSMLIQKNSAFFSKECSTLYRQHTQNIIGLKRINAARLEKILDAKVEHYKLLSDLGFETRILLNSEIAKKKYLSDNTNMNNALFSLNERKLNFFWWEETNYINEKD